MTRGDWAVLGIDPTIDKSAIRRAYATKLKAMDVDADPDGFARLRAARDATLAGADSGTVMVADEPDEDADWIDDGDWFDEIDVARAHHEPPVADADGELTAAIDAHYRALVDLLFADDAPPTVTELDAIAHHGRALLADPRLEQVDFAASAERWFADNLASAVPRSDPLLEPAAAAFGWIDRRDDYTLLPAAREVVERIGATRYVALLSDPSHRLHRAWQDLTHADGRKLRGRGDVAEVMTTVRTRYPIAEHWMEPERVAQWDAAAVERTSPGKITVWAIIAVVVILRLLMNGGSEPEPVRVPVVQVMPDANAAAQTLTGRRIGEVEAVNPGLADAIRRAVVPPADPADVGSVYRAIAELRYQRLVAGMADAPDPLIRDLARWTIDAMRARRSISPTSCISANVAMPSDNLPEPLPSRQRALLQKVVLRSRNTPRPSSDTSFMLPASLMPAIARRSGFDIQTVTAALNDQRSDADRCTVEIALREAALDAPEATGDRLLRDMEPLFNE
ncbi:hypothetical protein [Sphingomonas sp. CFBP 13720]|uniref:hypothetical protein n=1 Tax=Sphingomonas sp. CFBP 13720 TaxID=2775302 RepID=UPI00177C2AEF|nr:hypothetical protein [Sphingomonas sp. CFBP 13720]MBD8678279.1 hypothetical protein [Sphingomonas sp. CFBP 13720]